MGQRILLLMCLAVLGWTQEVTEVPTEEFETTPITNTSTTTSVPILRQINEVNDDGTYTYGFEAADGTFKIETRDDNGNVKGKYGFIDDFGELKIVEYMAGNGTGFEAESDLLPQQVPLPPINQIPQELPRIPSLPPRRGFHSRGSQQFGADPRLQQPHFASSQPQPQFSHRPQPQPQFSPRPQPQIPRIPPQFTPRPRPFQPQFSPRPQPQQSGLPTRPLPQPKLISRPQPQEIPPPPPQPQFSHPVPQSIPQQSQILQSRFPPQQQGLVPQQFQGQPQFPLQQFSRQPQFPPQQFPRQPQFPPQQFSQQPQFPQRFGQQPQFLPPQQPLPQRPQRPVNIAIDGFSEDRNQDGFVDGSPEEAAKGRPVAPATPSNTPILPAGTLPLPRPTAQPLPVQARPQQTFLPQQPQNPFLSQQVPQSFSRFVPQSQVNPAQPQLAQLTPAQIQQIRQQQLLAAQQGRLPQQQFVPQQFAQQQFIPQHFSNPRFAAQQFGGQQPPVQQIPHQFSQQPFPPQRFAPQFPPQQPTARSVVPRPAAPPGSLSSLASVQSEKTETGAKE